MIRWWAFWRRVQYIAALTVLLSCLSVWVYYAYVYQAPSCFDGIQNSEERGVDCGGACTRICAIDILAPQVLWVESFKIVNGQYNAVAYIENRNKVLGSPDLQYTIKLSDAKGVIEERRGVTVFPPDGVFPIFEGRIMTGSRVPTETTIEFATNATWLPAETGREQFVLKRRELSGVDSKPRLIAQMENTSLDEARDVEIIATIFNAAKKPLTASRTVVPYFSGRTIEDVVFTWPEPIAKTLRSCETPTDVVLAIDLSGSMNNDGGTPAEPITSVLTAAESFVSRLNRNDQIGVVTYATNAIVAEPLTSESTRVADVISNLRIDPKEEQGTTNTGDALKRIREELSSARHSDDARKVAILLTDGLATAPGENPEMHAQTEAEALKNLGINLFTIGLGGASDEAFLRGLASLPTQYYRAPSISELHTIYTSITADICEDGAAVIEIIPKAETSFTPLQ